MLASAFKKYDIRGIVGNELTIDAMYQLTIAIAQYFKQQCPHATTVIVGMDGRTHSPAIKEQVCRALIDSGLSVYAIGIVPTPLFYFANHILNAQAGIMITASHNPKDYNGLKLMLEKVSVFDGGIQEIKSRYFSAPTIPEKTVPGSYLELNLNETYIHFLMRQFSHLKNSPISVVFDCAHGATATIVPALVKAMGWHNAHILYGTLDGTFPAHEADPSKEEAMHDLQKFIAQHPAYCGIGFDGDGDRMAAVTEEGIRVQGDEHGAIFCQEIGKNIPHCHLIADVKYANAILNTYSQAGMTCTLTPCGVGFVRQAMRAHNAAFGGEISCHYCFADRYFGFDDGIYAALRLLEILHNHNQPLQNLYNALPERYCSAELRLQCSHEAKHTIVKELHNRLALQSDLTISTIDGIRVSNNYGCASIRPSNTEPILSARFEGTSKKNLDRIIDEFYMLLLPYFDEKYLTMTLKREK